MTLPSGVWRIVDELKDTLGDTDAEVIRNIVISHLSDRGILIPSYTSEGTLSVLLREMKTQNAFVEILAKLLEKERNAP